jgi:hypothetical protein
MVNYDLKRDGAWFRLTGVAAPDGFGLADRPPVLLEGTTSPHVWLFNSAIP